MKAIGIGPAPRADATPGTGADAEALFKEARRRQRRRYLLAGLAAAAVTAAALGALAGLRTGGHPPQARPVRPAPALRHPARRALSGPVLGGRAGSVLMWPTAGSGFGNQAYLANLGTGHVSLAPIPHGIDPGDYDPYLIQAGRWLVYEEGGAGTLAVRGDLRGRARVLGRTFEFAPSAAPGRVWLVTMARSNPVREVSARLVPVAGGPPGRAVRLPAGSALVEGTDAGLLLISRHSDLELWTPGRGTPVRLAHLPWPRATGFAADARLAAYGTGCRLMATSDRHGYQACRTLRVLNLVTGARYSFPAPPGTAGWALLFGFHMDEALAPGSTMIAAEAIIGSRQGLVRVFVLHLNGARQRPVAIPHSAGFFPKTAWSSDGRWLLYQGPGKRLWAYRVTTGTVRPSTVPCCWYTVMVTVPAPARLSSRPASRPPSPAGIDTRAAWQPAPEPPPARRAVR